MKIFFTICFALLLATVTRGQNYRPKEGYVPDAKMPSRSLRPY
jgi:hypothetical protein